VIIVDLHLDVQNLEEQIPLLFGSSATEVPGARSLLSQVRASHVPWAIVTSGTRPLVTGWLKILKIPFPPHLITAEDVENGKPHPACYLLGQKKLGREGCRSDQALVIEDAPAGIRAGKAAGFKVLALATTHEVEELREAGADWVVGDLRSMIIGKGNGGHSVEVEISDTL
jgi:glycerol 3-phosphatase-1